MPSSAPPPPPAAPRRVEVERKFVPPPDLARRVAALRGRRVLGPPPEETTSVEEITDAYWDVWPGDPGGVALPLTTRDVWLRRRSAAGGRRRWEMKVPLEAGDRSGGETQVFEELEGATAVAAGLSPWLGETRLDDEGDDEDEALAAALTARGLAPLLVVRTVRTSWTLPLDDDDVRLDADVAEVLVPATGPPCRAAVLEIECLVGGEAEVPEARRRIARAAALLGAVPLGAEAGGKVETALRATLPDVAARLVAAGVLAPAAPGKKEG